MIDRREILEAASSFSLLPSIVEKDDVLGWMLAGIYPSPVSSLDLLRSGDRAPRGCPSTFFRASSNVDSRFNHCSSTNLVTFSTSAMNWSWMLS